MKISKMNAKNILQNLIVFLFYTQIQAQFNVSGVAYDYYGNSIKEATIELYSSNFQQQTTSDALGTYFFENIANGSYTLKISNTSYSSKYTIKVKDEDLYYDLVLEGLITEGQLDHMVIDVKSTKDRMETSGFAVNVIDTKEASLQSLQTNELLDRTAGVRIRQDGGLGSQISYNVNGMTGNAVKIFINGVPASHYGQSFSLNSIPPALIERIEVYKGVVPAHLADDALGGAINVILKQNKRNIVNTSYSFGSFNTHQYNLNGSFINNKGFSVDISGFYNYSDNNYEVWGQDISFRNYQGSVTPNQRAKRFHDAYRSYGTKVDAGWTNVKWADRFMVGALFSDDYNEIQHGITMQRVFGDRHSRRNAKVANLNYSKKDLFINGLSLNIDASYSIRRTQVIDTIGIMHDWRGPILFPDGTPVRYNSGSELGGNKTAVINTDKSMVVRAGLGYQITDNNSLFLNFLYNTFERKSEDEFLPLGLQLLENSRQLSKSITSVTYENLAFSRRLRTNIFYKYYAQKVTLNEPYQISTTPLQYGVTENQKLENYNGYGIALSYKLLPKFFILGSAEKAIRFPNEREIFGNPADNLNPGDVGPEQSFNANIGFNIGAFIYKKHSLRLNTSLFYRDTKGMIREAITPGNSGTSYYENLEDVLTKGIDAEIIYNYGEKLNFSLNISKFDVLFNTQFNKEGAEYLFYRQQIRNEPSFKYNANISYYINNLFLKNSRSSVYYNINYVKGFRRNWSNIGSTNLDNIPTQFANDLGFMYTFPSQKVTFSFDAKNIFNQQLYDNFGLQKPGRAFYGKITYNIL